MEWDDKGYTTTSLGGPGAAAAAAAEKTMHRTEVGSEKYDWFCLYQYFSISSQSLQDRRRDKTIVSGLVCFGLQR